MLRAAEAVVAYLKFGLQVALCWGRTRQYTGDLTNGQRLSGPDMKELLDYLYTMKRVGMTSRENLATFRPEAPRMLE